jgi:hypothetical protein
VEAAMIDAHLLARYRRLYGDTFNVLLWAGRPGEAVNNMMRAALASRCTPLSDATIAAELETRVSPPELK